MKTELDILLEKIEQNAKRYDEEIKLIMSQINNGFSEGKDEQAWQTVGALKKALNGSHEEIFYVLNDY